MLNPCRRMAYHMPHSRALSLTSIMRVRGGLIEVSVFRRRNLSKGFWLPQHFDASSELASSQDSHARLNINACNRPIPDLSLPGRDVSC